MTDYVSIIVPVSKVPVESLEAHLQRLAAHGAQNIECIIVAGDSIEETPAFASAGSVCKTFGFAKAAIITQQDTSHLDAINLGAEAATGSVLTWMNIDDSLIDGAVQAVQSAHAEAPDAIVYGNSQQVGPNGEDFGPYPVSPRLTESVLLQRCAVSQPAAWIPNSVWSALGGLSGRYQYGFDYDFWFRALKANVEFRYIDDQLAQIEVRPDARSFSGRTSVLREACEIQMQYGGRCLPSALTSIWAEALTPSFGFDDMAGAVLGNAPEALQRLKRAATQRGDHQALEILDQDQRLWMMSFGIAAEIDQDGRLNDGASIRFLQSRREPAFLLRLNELPEDANHIDLVEQDAGAACTRTQYDQTQTIIFRPAPRPELPDGAVRELRFLSLDDCGARLNGIVS